MKIVLLSTFKEEYMLQWWLPHHAKKFDFGVIADFNYNENDGDKTYELFKKYVPNWAYAKVMKPEVSNREWDIILQNIENDIYRQFPNSWVTCLNPTEFLIGDLSTIDSCEPNSNVLIPCHLMIDQPSDEGVEPDVNLPLLQQRTHGIHYTNDFPHPFEGKTSQKFYEDEKRLAAEGVQLRDKVVHNIRWMRSIHNYNLNYLSDSHFGVGRHFWDANNYSKDLAICHMNLSPYTDTFINRKLNVQTRLTQEDHMTQRGIHHRVDREKLTDIKKFYDPLVIDLKDEINKLEKF
jgi:hypothetical protein